MTHRPRLFVSLLLALSFAISLPACAAVGPLLPKLVSVITDAVVTLNVIDSAVEQWVARHPEVDPKVVAAYRAAYARCEAALAAANHALAGAKDLDQDDVDAAFEEFRIAYLALRDMLVLDRIAVPTPNGELSVGSAPDAIVLPTPEALTYRIGR